ncbi:MAG: porin family protein [Phocaeicola sp.]
MKKLVGLLLVIICLGLTLPAQAQLNFGVKGGLNVSKVSLSSSTFNPDNRAGWFIGPMAELTLPIIGIGVDAAALYTQNELATDDNSATLKTLEVPVNLKWTMGLGSTLGIYVAAGPQFGFNIGNSYTDFWNLEKNNTSFNIGAGVKLISHLQLGINYNFALSNAAEIKINDEVISVKRNAWQISAAYIF